jgi:hypothetical protein
MYLIGRLQIGRSASKTDSRLLLSGAGAAIDDARDPRQSSRSVRVGASHDGRAPAFGFSWTQNGKHSTSGNKHN